MVGDIASVVVQQPATTNLVLTSYTWTVSGGETSQSYNWHAGVTNPANGAYIVKNVNGSETGFNFYWDDNIGQHTVDVSAIFTNPVTGALVTADPVTLIANLEAPSVGSFTNQSQPLQFSDQYNRPGYPTGSIGFHQGLDGGTVGNSAIQPGDQFSATVTLPNVAGGQFAFITLINVDQALTTNQGDKYTQKSGGFVLDPVPDLNNTNNVLVMNYISLTYQPGAQASIPEPNYGQGTAYVGTLPDGPWLAYQPGPNVPTYTQFRLVDSFQTYLVYSAPSGIWVGISMVSWNLSGDETWNANTNSWQPTYVPMPILPNTSSTATGVNNNSFVKWTNSYPPFAPGAILPNPATNTPGLGVPWYGPKGVNDPPPNGN